MHAFVLDRNRKPLTPCRMARARILLKLVPRPAKSDELLLQATYHGFKRTRRLSLDF